MSKKRAYGQLSVRAHIGDDARVKLFSGGMDFYHTSNLAGLVGNGIVTYRFVP